MVAVLSGGRSGGGQGPRRRRCHHSEKKSDAQAQLDMVDRLLDFGEVSSRNSSSRNPAPTTRVFWLTFLSSNVCLAIKTRRRMLTRGATIARGR